MTEYLHASSKVLLNLFDTNLILGSLIQKAKISLRNSSIARASGVRAGVAADEEDSVVSKFEDEAMATRIAKNKRKEMGRKDFISVINVRTGVDGSQPT